MIKLLHWLVKVKVLFTISNDYKRKCIIKGKFQVLWTTPEILFTDKNWSRAHPYLISLIGFVINEAHCKEMVSIWIIQSIYIIKYMFMDYFPLNVRNLGDSRGCFPMKLNVMALTATASMLTRKEVSCLLGMVKTVIIS